VLTFEVTRIRLIVSVGVHNFLFYVDGKIVVNLNFRSKSKVNYQMC